MRAFVSMVSAGYAIPDIFLVLIIYVTNLAVLPIHTAREIMFA
jgi:hypothetical protein